MNVKPFLGFLVSCSNLSLLNLSGLRVAVRSSGPAGLGEPGLPRQLGSRKLGGIGSG